MRRMLVALLGVWLVAIAASADALLEQRRRLRGRTSIGGGSSRQLLTEADFSCVGVFRTPYLAGSLYAPSPVPAVRVVGGARQYFVYGAGGGAANPVYEHSEPTLSSCATAPASSNTASYMGWSGDWGSWPGPLFADTSGGFVPGVNESYSLGLTWDEIGSQLILHWHGAYFPVPTGINISSAVTLNENTHVMTRRGCWGFDGEYGTQLGTGLLHIPSWFTTAHLTTGQRFAFGLGGHSGYASTNSYGVTLTAVADTQLADNDCLADYPIATANFRKLSQYPLNLIGPMCNAVEALEIGCDPATAPTSPEPMHSNWTAYSGEYAQWEPYPRTAGVPGEGAHGWWGFGIGGKTVWHDSATKTGLVTLLRVPSGVFNQDVSASPAPTRTPAGVAGPVGDIVDFTVPTLDTLDGALIEVGNRMWVETCEKGVAEGCPAENGNWLSDILVTAVNTGTKLITATVVAPDGTGGSGDPRIGGQAKMGCTYHYGGARCDRFTNRMQITDPQEYIDVINGAALYSPQAASEFDLDTLVPGMVRMSFNASHGSQVGVMIAGDKIILAFHMVIGFPVTDQFIVYYVLQVAP